MERFKMNRIISAVLVIYLFGVNISGAINLNNKTNDKKYTISKEKLLDKIKGGWAGQVIGVTYGGSTEFQYCGTYIKDYTPIPWEDGFIKNWFTNSPGLYDDIYMDLTFVSVFEKYGMNAPVDSFALAFANAKYPLWHANQNARYNILHKIMPPLSGNWKNNPHADDIDFQIEADFAGLMSPCMINTSAEICDKIGHIMNYGDGWYGGVYMASMYSLAFYMNNISEIVKEALKVIPEESDYYKCINDVINWHNKYPGDWHKTWQKLEEKWGDDLYCPDGVFRAFNIDTKMNSAYVVIGLLYGNMDFSKTMDIATRCGQDSDCNPASAAGILGTLIGYNNIPEQWRKNVTEVEDMNFIYTDISLSKVYQLGFKHACKMIEANNGKITNDEVEIPVQTPKAVRLEKSFDGLYPSGRKILLSRQGILYDSAKFTFNFFGKGLVIRGNALCEKPDLPKNISIYAELYIDGKLIEIAELPLDFNTRRHELFSNYNLPESNHTALIKLHNPLKDYGIRIGDMIFYSSKK
jgi:hypothetical protein